MLWLCPEAGLHAANSQPDITLPFGKTFSRQRAQHCWVVLLKYDFYPGLNQWMD